MEVAEGLVQRLLDVGASVAVGEDYGDLQELTAASGLRNDVTAELVDDVSGPGRCDGLVVLARTAPAAMIEHVATGIPVVLLATGESGGRPVIERMRMRAGAMAGSRCRLRCWLALSGEARSRRGLCL